jgi:Cd2+/Zn2+-exporting ATPase
MGARADAVVCSTCELHAEAVFRVEGMDCHEEVVILERRLKPLAGLEALSADVVGQRLHVKYDAALLTTSAMVDAVGQTGMRMWLEHEEPTASGSDVRTRLLLMVGAGVGIAGGLALTAASRPVLVAEALYVTATLVGAVFPLRRALTALRSRTIDINVLMVVAVAGALALGERLEAATVVFLFALAQWLEVRTLEGARQAIRALLDLSPRFACVRRAGVEQRVPVEEVVPGDRVLIRPGEKVAVDGVVAAGRSEVNEAPLTGESLPVEKAGGDEVYAGTINGRGALELTVSRVGRDTRLARIIHLVEEAQARRAPVQSFVDRFARIYTPAVIALAAVVAIVPAVLAGADAATWIYRGLTLLVIACPCALVISTPVSIVSALAAAARSGVLVKGGAHLERLAEVNVVAFDKTGTLTSGTLQVADLFPAANVSVSDLLGFAAAVEAASEHPIGRAIARHAHHAGIDVPRAGRFQSLPGLGAEAEVAGQHVVVGNRRLLQERGIVLPAAGREGPPYAPPAVGRQGRPFDADGTDSANGAGRSQVYVAADGIVLGSIAMADRLRDTAREAIDLLRSHGIRRVIVLTGDEAAPARSVADSIGVDELHAGLLPDRKHALIQSLRGDGRVVLMVGDGVNDAPALAAADVGVAMGAAGSDVAIETADVALMSDELLKLPFAVRLARATLRNVKTNVAVSLLLKAAFLVMALLGAATLWMAVLADTGASVIVVANALRLLRER